MKIFLYILFVGGILPVDKAHEVEMPSMKSCIKVMEKSKKRDDVFMYCGTQNNTWCVPKLDAFELEELD